MVDETVSEVIIAIKAYLILIPKIKAAIKHLV